MRREIGELFGDVFERTGFGPRRGFSPAVDVYYHGDPPRAIVRAELAGVDIDGVGLEIRGRQLVIAGERRAAESAGAALPADRDRAWPVPARGGAPGGRGGQAGARDLHDGILEVEIPLAVPREVLAGAGRSPASANDDPDWPLQGAGRVTGEHLASGHPAGAPVEGRRAVPRRAHAARIGQPAVDQLVNDVLDRNGMLAMVALTRPESGGEADPALRRGRGGHRGADDEGAGRHAPEDPRPGSPASADRGLRLDGPLSGGQDPGGAGRGRGVDRAPGPGAERPSRPSPRSSRRSRTCPGSSSSRWPTWTTGGLAHMIAGALGSR